MNIRKIAFFITSAAILVSGMAAEASARTVDESGKTRISSIVLIEASLKSGTQSNGLLAFNPQPAPPGARDQFGDYSKFRKSW
ncbi:MAG: hypothetical protein WA733_19220 [Methylocystis sp.]